MATKKKNSPSDSESKALSFQEAQRQERRADELWDPSSPKMTEMYRALERFRASFSDALDTVDGFVSECHRVSGELRKEQCEELANSLRGQADKWGEVASPEFQEAATKLVDLVYKAFIALYPKHVLTVAKRVSGRDRAEWVRLCGSMRDLLHTDSPEQRRFAVWLIDLLTEIDKCAERLKPEQVIEAANNPEMTSAAGFAGEIARLCGAWGYRDQQAAKKAFVQAMKRDAAGTYEFR